MANRGWPFWRIPVILCFFAFFICELKSQKVVSTVWHISNEVSVFHWRNPNEAQGSENILSYHKLCWWKRGHQHHMYPLFLMNTPVTFFFRNPWVHASTGFVFYQLGTSTTQILHWIPLKLSSLCHQKRAFFKGVVRCWHESNQWFSFQLGQSFVGQFCLYTCLAKGMMLLCNVLLHSQDLNTRQRLCHQKAVARVATEILDPPFLSAQNVRLSTTQEQMLQAQSDASSLRNQLQVGRLVKLWKKSSNS